MLAWQKALIVRDTGDGFRTMGALFVRGAKPADGVA